MMTKLFSLAAVFALVSAYAHDFGGFPTVVAVAAVVSVIYILCLVVGLVVHLIR